MGVYQYLQNTSAFEHGGKMCILLKVYKVFVSKRKDLVKGVTPAAIPEVVSPQGTYFNVPF